MGSLEPGRDGVPAERLAAERNRIVYGALGIAVAASTALALLLLVVQWGPAGWQRALPWTLAFAGVSGWRLLTLRRYRRSPDDNEGLQRAFVQGATAAGAVWGLSSVLLFPADAAHQVFLAFVIAGVCAGGVSTLAAAPAAATAFLSLSLAPLALRLVMTGGLMANAMAIMTMLFLGFLVLSARRIAGTLTENSVLRFQEEARRDEERAQAALLQRMGEMGRIGIWEFDVQTGAISWSDELYRMYGLPRDAPLSVETALAAFAEPDRSQVAAGVARVLAEGTPYEAEHQLVNHAGEAIWTRVVVHPVKADGAVARIHGITQNVTERRRVDALKSEFVSTVSHELRTPLTSIRGSLGLVASGAAGALPERASRLLQVAARNSERLILLINDLLDIEKIESGNMDFSIRRQPLMPLVQQAVESTATYAAEYGVRYELHGTTRAQVDVDGERLVQVLVNLLSNAAKFSPRDSAVRIAVAEANGCVRIDVIDQGEGIPESFLPRLFDKFSQADSSDQRQKGGTGLGLAISKAIMVRLGGTIDVQTAPGAGSTFTLELPLSGELRRASAATGDASPGHVLLVELEAGTAMAICDELMRASWRVTTVSRVAGVTQHREHDPSIDLALVCLPAGAHYAWLRDWFDVKQQMAGLPAAAVMSGGGDMLRFGAAMPVVAWLAKPADMAVLHDVLRAAYPPVNGRPPLLLYVEDDVDLTGTVAEGAGAAMRIDAASTIAEARRMLPGKYDGVLLDLALPDGSGWEMMDLMRHLPVVVFSAVSTDSTDAARAAPLLLPRTLPVSELTYALAQVRAR